MSSAAAASRTLNKGNKRFCYSGMTVFHDEFLMWRCRKAVQCSLIKNFKKNKVNTYIFLINSSTKRDKLSSFTFELHFGRINLDSSLFYSYWCLKWGHRLLTLKMTFQQARHKNTFIDTGRRHVPLMPTYLILILGFLNNSHQLFCSRALILPKHAAVS